MRVFVVLGWWDREGNDDPVGVFSSRELAQTAIESGYDNYGGVDIIEYEIDHMPEHKQK